MAYLLAVFLTLLLAWILSLELRMRKLTPLIVLVDLFLWATVARSAKRDKADRLSDEYGGE